MFYKIFKSNHRFFGYKGYFLRCGILVILSFSSCVAIFRNYPQGMFPITKFSKEELAIRRPLGWKTHKGICRDIKSRVLPEIVEIEGKHTLYVNASNNGTILFKPVNLKAEDFPLLSWKWKVSNILPESREREIGLDDYPAAVCIVYGKTFFSIPYWYRILIYAYGNNIPAGERFENPCEPRAKMIIVESGEENIDKWLSYKVNHYRDYIEEFGQKPPGIIYVGIQTNADRTHGKVEAWYADIELSKDFAQTKE